MGGPWGGSTAQGFILVYITRIRECQERQHKVTSIFSGGGLCPACSSVHPPPVLQDRVFETALSSRLFKLSCETDPPFASAALGQEPLTATIQTHTLTATPMEGGS